MGNMFMGTTNLNGTVVPTDLTSLEYPDLPRLKMDRHGTIEDFTTVALRAMKLFQGKIMKRGRETWVPLVASYPGQKITENSFIRTRTDLKTLEDFYFLHPFADLVTYTLRFQAPAGIHTAFGKERQRAPQHRETFSVPDQPGILYEVVALPMDNLVQFDCWSSTGRGADNLASWFKTFMEFMKGSIMRQGFSKIEFWERGVDKDVTQWRDDIACRTLQYYVRTEEFYIIPRTAVTQINLELEVHYDLDEESDLFLREMQGHPVSGVIDPDTIPEIADLVPPVGTAELTDHG
jgi:hypothetical protein